jgi:hypothetical protein
MGLPRGGSVTKKLKTPCPPFLGEALRWGGFVEMTIFIIGVRTDRYMTVSTEPPFVSFKKYGVVSK